MGGRWVGGGGGGIERYDALPKEEMLELRLFDYRWLRSGAGQMNGYRLIGGEYIATREASRYVLRGEGSRGGRNGCARDGLEPGVVLYIYIYIYKTK